MTEANKIERFIAASGMEKIDEGLARLVVSQLRTNPNAESWVNHIDGEGLTKISEMTDKLALFTAIACGVYLGIKKTAPIQLPDIPLAAFSDKETRDRVTRLLLSVSTKEMN